MKLTNFFIGACFGNFLFIAFMNIIDKEAYTRFNQQYFIKTIIVIAALSLTVYFITKIIEKCED